MTMKITIGKFDKASGTVPVTFEHAEVTHSRAVNAVIVGGKYDAKATAERVNAVARGVEAKIAVGAITNPPPVEVSLPAVTNTDAGPATQGDA